jgi:hypothetical protein
VRLRYQVNDTDRPYEKFPDMPNKLPFRLSFRRALPPPEHVYFHIFTKKMHTVFAERRSPRQKFTIVPENNPGSKIPPLRTIELAHLEDSVASA